MAVRDVIRIAAVADIGHAFRVTVRSTNGYVYPASHRAGSTTGSGSTSSGSASTTRRGGR